MSRRGCCTLLLHLLSFGLLAFMPFLWLALVRRRGRDWAVFAAYLAAVIAYVIVATLASYTGNASNMTNNWTGLVVDLVVVAAVHTVVAFSPAAGPATFRQATAAKAVGVHQKPVTDAVGPEDSPEDQ